MFGWSMTVRDKQALGIGTRKYRRAVSARLFWTVVLLQWFAGVPFVSALVLFLDPSGMFDIPLCR